jgi:hypothetical protein
MRVRAAMTVNAEATSIAHFWLRHRVTQSCSGARAAPVKPFAFQSNDYAAAHAEHIARAGRGRDGAGARRRALREIHTPNGSDQLRLRSPA